jgi:VWFA-related protein
VTLFGAEPGGEEGFNQHAGERRTDDARPDAEHVDIVVLDTLARGVRVVTDRRANPWELGGRDRDAGAASAEQHPSIGLAIANGRGDGLGNVGIVHGSAGVRSQIQYFVTLLGHRPREVPFQLKPGMVGAHGYTHCHMLTQAVRSPRSSYTEHMQYKPFRLRLAMALCVTLGVGLLAQTPASPPGSQPQPPATPPGTQPQTPQTGQPRRPDFSVNIDLVTMDVIVRDNKDQFIADLGKDEFELFEDGIKQELASFTLVHGGRVHNLMAPPPPPTQEGIILPPSRPRNDAAGRIFLIVVDDLHLDFRNTGRIRELFKTISKQLVHDGDMFGIVSTGPSSLAIDLTYDHKILQDAIKKIAGNGLNPQDIIQGAEGAEGPSEVRYRAHVAFSTVYDILGQLERITNRRKAIVWVSNGFDFNPFAESRLGEDPVFGGRFGQTREEGRQEQQNMRSGNVFADADLARDLGDLTRRANRANATIYTIDPRGLVAGPDLDQQLDPVEYGEHVRKTQDSLRVLADETGGIAVVNQNDFKKALTRIDNETSDYYVVGYYSTNPDPMKRTRKIEVKVKKPGLNVWSRTSYTLRPTPAASQK